MLKLIKFELTNIFKGISFYICGASILVMAISSIGVRALADMLMTGLSIPDLNGIGYSGQMFLLQSPSQSDFPLLIGILATICVCSGYSEKTYRNLWSRGFSRVQVFAGKAISISVAAIVYCIISMISGFIVGSIVWGVGANWNLEVMLAIIIEILTCIAIGLLYVATSFIFKKMGICIVIAVMTPSLLTIGSTAMDYILEFKEISFRVSPYIINNVLFEVSVTPNDKMVLASGFLCFAAYFVTAIVVGIMGMRKDEI